MHFAATDEPVNSLVGEKLQAGIEVNRKTNQPNWPAPPFHSIFQPRHSWVLGVDNLAKWQKNMLQLKRFGRLFGHKSADS